jgi:hypothetical protein
MSMSLVIRRNAKQKGIRPKRDENASKSSGQKNIQIQTHFHRHNYDCKPQVGWDAGERSKLKVAFYLESLEFVTVLGLGVVLIVRHEKPAAATALY